MKGHAVKNSPKAESSDSTELVYLAVISPDASFPDIDIDWKDLNFRYIKLIN